MSTTPLEEAVERVERALVRIERAVERGAMHKDVSDNAGRDERLRARVADALAELDIIIGEAERG
jgi:hypothetical protein